ncbi:hypothetical protein DFH06DRAFT_1127577 [Mycena polygramma]|nr:hypothetical protein DFH06DRAFT_1127577 [Mycena polygramma]
MGPLSLLEAFLVCVEDTLLIRLLSFWHLSDIFDFSGLSCVANGIIKHYKNLVWDVDTHFGLWFTESGQKFRSALRRSSAVVSGSQMLQFLDRATYRGSDMDIFLRIGGVPGMVEWLLSQGYSRTSQPNDYQSEGFQEDVLRVSSQLILGASTSQSPIRAVFNYRRLVASTSTVYDQRIQLIVVDTDPVCHILYDFHSTAVMNYMTSDIIVSPFPVSTFMMRKSYVTKSRTETSERESAWKQKYRKRGFKMIESNPRGRHNDLKLGKRTAADRRSWVMRLDPDNTADPTSDRSVYGPVDFNAAFEVLTWRSGVAHTGSFARLAEPGIWRRVCTKHFVRTR